MLFGLFHAAELDQRLASRLGGSHPAADVLFDEHLEMAGQFGRQITVAALFAKQATQSQEPSAKLSHGNASIRSNSSSLVSQGDHGIDAHRPPRRDVAREQCDCRQQERSAGVRQRVEGGNPEKKIADQSGQRAGRENSRKNAGPDDQQALAKDHFQNLRRLRAESQANADLVGALARRVRDHAVDTDQSEQQPQNSQGAGEHGGEPERQEAVQTVEHGGHRLHVEDRHSRLEGMNHSRDFRRKRLWRGGRAKLQRGDRDVMLCERNVIERLVVGKNIAVTAVSGDADDFHGVSGVIDFAEMPSDGILPVPVEVNEILIDDCDELGILTVGIPETTALQQRDAHGLEITGGNGVEVGGRNFFARAGLITVDLEFAVITRITHGDAHGQAGGGDAGQSAGAVEERLLKLPRLRFLIASLMRINRRVQDVAGVEAEVGVLDFFKAADEEAGDDQQHQRASDLPYDQRTAEPLPARSGGASAFVEDFVQIGARDAQRGSDSDQDSGEGCGGQGVREDAPVKPEIQKDRD